MFLKELTLRLARFVKDPYFVGQTRAPGNSAQARLRRRDDQRPLRRRLWMDSDELGRNYKGIIRLKCRLC